MSKNDILKKAEEYMKLKYRFELTEDEAEGGYVISYPDLIGCMSSGETIEEAVKNGEDARREWFIAALECGMEIPKPSTVSALASAMNWILHNIQWLLGSFFIRSYSTFSGSVFSLKPKRLAKRPTWVSTTILGIR